MSQTANRLRSKQITVAWGDSHRFGRPRSIVCGLSCHGIGHKAGLISVGRRLAWAEPIAQRPHDPPTHSSPSAGRAGTVVAGTRTRSANLSGVVARGCQKRTPAPRARPRLGAADRGPRVARSSCDRRCSSTPLTRGQRGRVRAVATFALARPLGRAHPWKPRGTSAGLVALPPPQPPVHSQAGDVVLDPKGVHREPADKAGGPRQRSGSQQAAEC